jgi:predicted porin
MNHSSRRAIVLAAAALAANSVFAQVQDEANVLREAAAHRDGLAFHRPGLDVGLYGLLDLTLSTANNKDAKGNRLTNFDTPWFSGSRWGIIGSRSLPDGAPSVIFKLEGEFIIPTGKFDTDNTIFNRDAWVGFYGDGMGKLTFGRQNTLPRDFSGNYGDPYLSDGQVTLEERGWTNTNNFKQMIYYAASPTSTRWDRGVVWKKQWGQFVTGLGHQFQSPPPGGQDPVAGQNSHNTSNSAGVAWNGGVFNASGFLNRSDVNTFRHNSWSVGGNAGLGSAVRIYGGVFRYKAEQPAALGDRQDKAWTTSIRFAPAGKLDYEVGYAHFHGDKAGLSSSGFIRNPYADTSSLTRVATGSKGTLYASVFYHFDRTTEVYIAGDRMSTKDGWADPRSFGKDSQTELAIGVRTRF